MKNAYYYCRLSVGAYSGDAGNALNCGEGYCVAVNRKFTTIDSDNDVYGSTNCADINHGGWWYSTCHHANVNGRYNSLERGEGLNWQEWHGFEYSLKSTEMKIRPAGYNWI